MTFLRGLVADEIDMFGNGLAVVCTMVANWVRGGW